MQEKSPNRKPESRQPQRGSVSKRRSSRLSSRAAAPVQAQTVRTSRDENEKDCHNAKNSMNQLTRLGPHEGGQLWVKRPDGDMMFGDIQQAQVSE